MQSVRGVEHPLRLEAPVQVHVDGAAAGGGVAPLRKVDEAGVGDANGERRRVRALVKGEEARGVRLRALRGRRRRPDRSERRPRTVHAAVADVRLSKRSTRVPVIEARHAVLALDAADVHVQATLRQTHRFVVPLERSHHPRVHDRVEGAAVDVHTGGARAEVDRGGDATGHRKRRRRRLEVHQIRLQDWPVHARRLREEHVRLRAKVWAAAERPNPHHLVRVCHVHLNSSICAGR
mmetsp:Transcript_28229/g.92129  ORF Transcript_28229/g.92129 Transcript_28229/m.92129 type:complete len:236 (+) Transcript_28229:251-958(+)